jgi:DNA polymerase I-like protein with 3'-5' exonuclease and polymerase domains
MTADNKIFFDLETSIKNRGEKAIGKNKASPYCVENNIVYAGWSRGGFYSVGHEIPFRSGCTYIAHNIAFDLSHLMCNHSHWREAVFKKRIKIWDTMIVEYLLTGQRLTWASLDDLAFLYGGTQKDSRIKEYWEADIDTEDIPVEEILPYLEDDVKNLIIIEKGQRDLAEKLGMLPLIESQMEARLATIMMEFNGMSFDKLLAMQYAVALDRELDAVYVEQHKLMQDVFDCLPDCLNPNSNEQMSVYLFGGEFPTKQSLPQFNPDGSPIIYKTGQKKGLQKHKMETVMVAPGWGHVIHDPLDHSSVKNKKGFYTVNEETLKSLSNDNNNFADNALKIRELKKQISTYFRGYSDLVWPDGLIHGQLNHCQTATGRLSSSQPNLQNLSGKKS